MDDKRLDLNLLATLEALLQERNVTRAAARLHLSQPAVSAQLARLRMLFGDPLLVPAHRGMTPTLRALELVAPLRAAMDQARAVVATHQAFDPANAEMVVHLACSDYSQFALAAPLILALRREAPGIRVALRALDLARLEAQATGGDIDLAFVNTRNLPPGLRARPLFDERYVLIGRRGHPGLRRRPSLAAFARLEHVVVSPLGGGFSTPADEALAALGHRRKVVLSAASFLFVPEIVARSDFVALVPERLVRDRADALEVVECPFPAEGFALSMAWHERTHAHPGHRWIRERVVALASQAQGASKRQRANAKGRGTQ